MATPGMIMHYVIKQNRLHEHDNVLSDLQWLSQSQDLNPNEHFLGRGRMGDL